MSVTALIKTYERPDRVARLVESLRRHLPELPILVVDDSSTPEPIRGVEYLCLPHGSGISAGRNAGLDAVATRYFVLLDDDFVCTPGTVVPAMVELLDRTGLDLVGGDLIENARRRCFHGLLRICAGVVYHINGARRLRRHASGLPLYDKTYNFFVARTAAVRAVRWDERIAMRREHADFFLRARRRLGVTRDPSFTVEHDPGPRLYRGPVGDEFERRFNQKWRVRGRVEVNSRSAFVAHLLGRVLDRVARGTRMRRA